MEPIQRDGAWWHKQPDGSWLVFDVSSGQWLPSMGSPPPPPPPPPPVVHKTSGFGGKQITMPEVSRSLMIAGAACLALALLLGTALMFFGGDDPPAAGLTAASDSVDTTPELSKRKQFIHDADQICADIMTKVNKLPIPTSLEEAVSTMEQLKRIIQDARAAGAKLDVPKDARKGWVRMMGTDKDVAEFDAVIDALRRGDIAAFQAWEQENKGSGARDRKWAKRYGMAVCSQDLG